MPKTTKKTRSPKQSRSTRTAFVPRVILQAAFASVIPAVAASQAGCGSGTMLGVAQDAFGVADNGFRTDASDASDAHDANDAGRDVVFGVADVTFRDASDTGPDIQFTVAADAFGVADTGFSVADAGFSVADAGFSVADTGFNG